MASWCVFEHSSNCPNPLDSSHLLYTPNGTHTASKPLTNGASLTNGVSKEETMNAWCVVEHAKEIQRVTRPMPQPKGTEVVIKVDLGSLARHGTDLADYCAGHTLRRLPFGLALLGGFL